jgi:hypothetical protein
MSYKALALRVPCVRACVRACVCVRARARRTVTPLALMVGS